MTSNKKTPVDRILVNGNIHTLKNERDAVEALAIAGGKIAFAGANAEVLARFEAAEVIDLAGKTVIPGMGDSHMHFYSFCQSLSSVDLAGCRNLDEVIERLKARAEITPKGKWIEGVNFDQSEWDEPDGELPTRRDLDRASTEHPIVVKRVCLHVSMCNTCALETANVGADFPESADLVERGADGSLNGIFREQYTTFFDGYMGDPLADTALRVERMSRELKNMAKKGMTSMHTYAAEIWRYHEAISLYDELDKKGLLPLRVTVFMDEPESLAGQALISGDTRSDPEKKTQLGGYKLFADGSLGSRSAALLADYADDPGNRGIIVDDAETLYQKARLAAFQGTQTAVHAIGDRALDNVVTAFERVWEEMKEAGQDKKFCAPPFVIMHAQLANEDLIARLSRLPVVLNVQPVFVLTDSLWVEDRVGKERMRLSYPWKTYMENGILLTGGSDCPVEEISPMAGIASAVTRARTGEGAFLPQEKLSVYEAVCLFSKNIAFLTNDEMYRGTLEVGKFADLAVLDRDIFSVDPMDIYETQVVRTMLSGRDTWIAEG